MQNIAGGGRKGDQRWGASRALP